MVIGTVIDIERFSDLNGLMRMTAFVVSFVSDLKKAVEKVGGVCGELVNVTSARVILG